MEAVAHPNWSMGAKISVDSATMMNKGLELIEAHHLLPAAARSGSKSSVHPQSIVHGAVVYRDGSVLAQLGSPDMRTPIAYALAWPGRIETPAKRLDLAAIGRLTFEPARRGPFPGSAVAREALIRGGRCPTVFERGERDGGSRVPRRAHWVSRYCRDGRAELSRRIPEGELESLDDVYNFDTTAREIATGLSGLRNSVRGTA